MHVRIGPISIPFSSQSLLNGLYGSITAHKSRSLVSWPALNHSLMDQTKAAIEGLNKRAATITKTCRTQASRLEKRLYLDRFHRYEIAIASFAAGSLSTVLYIRLHARYWRRFPTSAHVPETYVQKQKWIKGCVTRCVLDSMMLLVKPCADSRSNEA